MTQLPELADVNTDQQDKGLQISLVIDRETAARLGVSPTLIDATLDDAYGQRLVSTIYAPLNQYHVVMEAAPQYWQEPGSLDHVYVSTKPGGPQIPLSAFAHYVSTNTPLAVNHQSQFVASTISFNLPVGVSLGQATQAIDAALVRIGVPSSIHGSFQGTAAAFQASLNSQPWLILAALIAVYIVLGVLYESYVHPITILSTLPSAGIGALLALKLFHTDFSIIALIGVILLIGIVKKNGIMMIDFALDAERSRGLSSRDSIFEACLLRFRPIMMTTMAALLAAVPLALSTGTAPSSAAAGHLHRGRADVKPALDLVHHAGGVPLSGSIQAVVAAGPRCRWATRGANRRLTAMERLEKTLTLKLKPACRVAWTVVALFGCTAGPDYVRPPVVTPAAYKEAQGWKQASPQDEKPRGNWWEVFNDPQLDALVTQVAISNQTIKAAEAQVRAAQAITDQARAAFLPVVTANASMTRSGGRPSSSGGNVNSTGGGGGVNNYNVSLDATWEIDLWGKIRRTVESNEASAQASEGDLRAATLSAQATLAEDYFMLRAQDAQIRLLNETAAAYEKSLQLTRNQYAVGVAGRADVVQAETQLKSTQAQAIDAMVLRAQLEHAIAILIGKPPAEFSIAVEPVPTAFPDHSGGAPVGAARTAPRYRGGRAPHRRRQRADWCGGIGFLSFAHAVGKRRLPEHAVVPPLHAAEPLLVARPRVGRGHF